MQIALTEEGTYPHHFGGVSVWCDQLIRGMPDYDFRLVALVATGLLINLGSRKRAIVV